MVNRVARNHARGLGLGAFLSGFVPGLLQYQLGQKRRAAIAFVSCFVLFFVGWVVVKERLYYWALLTPDTPPGGGTGTLQMLARFGLPITLPELLERAGQRDRGDARLGCYPERRTPVAPAARAFEHLFAWLTAASGMLAAFWSAAGHWDLRWRRDSGDDAPAPSANPALCAALSWLVPGLGHARAGQKDKGMLMGAAVVIVFVMGLLFSHGHAVDRAEASVWWIGQNLFGGGSLFAALVTGPWERIGRTTQELDLGVVLCTVAGLMNLVVMVDASRSPNAVRSRCHSRRR